MEEREAQIGGTPSPRSLVKESVITPAATDDAEWAQDQMASMNVL